MKFLINKKSFTYILVLICLFFYNISGNKFYTIPEKDLEERNVQTLEKENITNYSLENKKFINNNLVYIYEVDNKEHYIFTYTKSLIFNLFHLDDSIKTKESTINTLASNVRYHNILTINFDRSTAEILATTETNKDTITQIGFYVVIIGISSYIAYKKSKK